LELGFLAEWERSFEDRNGRPPSLNSMRAVMQALRSFFAFVDKFGLLIDSEGKPVRNPALALELPVIPVKPELDWLRPDEDGLLLSAAMNAREDIVVFFLRLTGLRLGEALGLSNRDVDLATGSIGVREQPPLKANPPARRDGRCVCCGGDRPDGSPERRRVLLKKVREPVAWLEDEPSHSKPAKRLNWGIAASTLATTWQRD
jgi:integrase